MGGFAQSLWGVSPSRDGGQRPVVMGEGQRPVVMGQTPSRDGGQSPVVMGQNPSCNGPDTQL